MNKVNPDWGDLYEKAIARMRTMTESEYNDMIRKQRESYARSIAEWPKPKYHWENGVKVYNSYEDYCND